MRPSRGVEGIVAVAGLGLLACGGGAPPAPAPPPPPPVESVLGSAVESVPEPDAGSPSAADATPLATTPAAPGVPITVVAKNLHASAALSVDANAIYWVDEVGGEVSRAPKRGGLTMTLYGASGTGFSPGSSIALESGDVYWIVDVDQGKTRVSTLSRLEKNGGKPTAIASSTVAQLKCVVVDAQSVYWVMGGAVMKATKAGGAAVPLVAGQTGANCVAIDDANAYVTLGGTEAKQYADGSVVFVPKKGGAAKVLASGSERASNVIVDGQNVYWQAASGVMKVAKAGGPVSALTSGGLSVDDIAVDDAYVYFTTHKAGSDGTVSRVSKEGGAVEVLASAQNHPAGIAVDSTSIYWTCLGTEEKKYADGTVNRREKP